MYSGSGSVLGPLLFLLFVNDMSDKFSDATKVMFAANPSMVISAKNVEELKQKVVAIKNKFNNWYNCNNLILNV